jgi:hypothetical protein
MSQDPRVSQVEYRAATSDEIARGLLGRLRLVVSGIVIESVALRRTLDGRLTLAWPVRADGKGRKHAVAHPVDDDARLSLEVQVFTKLGIKAEGPAA